MEIKKLEKPKRLQSYEYLSGRRELTADEQYDMYLIKLGFYDGELPFNHLSVKHLAEEVLMISDLRVNDGQWYQIDSIILNDWKLYLNEVKFISGSLSYHEGDLYVNGKKMKDDYLRKFKRVTELLEYALRKQGFNIEVVPNLVCMNPNMTFYGNSPELPILLYHQVQPFLKNIQPRTSNYTDRIAKFLLSLHSEDNPFEKKEIPVDFNTLNKGILCPDCRVKMKIKNSTKLICHHCYYEESKSEGVKRNIQEYQILFPNNEVRLHIMHSWCDQMVSRRTISDVKTLLKSKKREEV